MTAWLKEIWCEGDFELNTAAHLGYGVGNTLQEACDYLAKERPYFGKFYDRGAMTYKDCRLFDNYEDAKVSHG